MTERDIDKPAAGKLPHDTAQPTAPLPAPPENERLRDFDSEADTVRIERLTDRREDAS
ncbi:MAG: hypothetical protein ABI769_04840 [Pseudomonadota bacterium]